MISNNGRSPAIVMILAICCWPATSFGQDDELSLQFEGFLQPYRNIQIASSETGRIESVQVKIGQQVSAGDVLAVLDHDLQQAYVNVARQQAEAVGGIKAAQADQSLHQTRITQIEKLTREGFARPEELMRARADLAIATARVLQAEENQRISQAELARYELQLQRRTIRASVDGLVSDVIRQPGEFVSPTEPYLVRMIQVHPLIAVFNLPTAAEMKVGQKMVVRVGMRRAPVQGVVDSIAPEMDAESGTIQVRISIDNKKYDLTAGEKCWLDSGPMPNSDSLTRVR